VYTLFMQIITEVLVGSRLHGLHTEQSDYDYRGIHMYDLKEVLSPFKTLKNTSWIEGDVDNTSYELADFCKQATHGNATILEVFFSNEIKQTSPIANKMRNNWQKFMDTERFVLASRGYAANQYNKMNLFESQGVKGQERTAKFAIAYCRVLWQCSEFLKTGVFKCQIDEPELKQFLLTIKPLTVAELQVHIPRLTEMFMEMQRRVTDAHATTKFKYKPDIKWIEEFIYHAYTA
jgi:predicted nucleotidyltransferase